MTYKDYFVVEVKHNGKILRVKDDFVSLPFGSEYSIYLKNLSSRRASVKISVDGQDVLDGQSIVIDPNTSTELEGFMKGSIAKNKFKFIQKTKEIQEHRGDRVDDGFIRVEFAYEKHIEPTYFIHEIKYCSPFHWNYTNYFTGNSSDNFNLTKDKVYALNCSISDQPINSVYNSSVPVQDEGITVKGSECNQQFRYTTIGELEECQVIIIRLRGETDSGQQVSKPLTIDTKLICSTCGRSWKSNIKFCGNCGTFLE